jgi:maltose-binding protein MalE
MCAKSCGIQMNVRPSLPAPTIWPAASGITENTVHSTMMPASSEMELLPKPMTKAFSDVSSFERM